MQSYGIVTHPLRMLGKNFRAGERTDCEQTSKEPAIKCATRKHFEPVGVLDVG
jgi:hypothetical protein